MPATTVVTDYVDNPGWDPSGTNLSTFGVANDLKQRDIDDTMHMLQPSYDSLFTMLMHPDLRSRPAYAPRIEWFEDDILPRIVAAALGSTTGSDTATSIPVATGYGPYFRPGDLVKNDATGEMMLVSSIATDTLTVVRGIGAGGTGTLFTATTNTLVRIVNSQQQGSYNIAIRATQPSLNYNYAQNLRYKDGVTKDEAASRDAAAVGTLYEYKMRKKSIELRRDLEQAIWEGKRDNVLVAGQHPRPIMGGILSFINSNVTTFANSTNFDLKFLETLFRSVGRYNTGGNIVGFASPFFMSALNSFPLGKLALPSPDTTKYGVQIRSFQGGGLEVPFVVKQDWGDRSTSSPAPGGQAVFVNMDDIRLRYLRPIRRVENQTVYGDEDSIAGIWQTTVSLQVANEQHHGVFRNVTQYA